MLLLKLSGIQRHCGHISENIKPLILNGQLIQFLCYIRDITSIKKCYYGRSTWASRSNERVGSKVIREGWFKTVNL